MGPLPPQLGQTGVSLCPWCCQAAVSGRREAQTHTPKPYRPEELCRFVPHPRPHPPSPDRGIFSEAENPSHELSSSTEVIKHGWFVVIDVVLLPWTDPQTLESTPMIKKKKVRKLLVFCIYEGKKMPTISLNMDEHQRWGDRCCGESVSIGWSDWLKCINI